MLRLPGTAKPYTDAPIYARTSGYVKRWLVDIGTPVKRSELLAEIETPEVDQQLRQARADEATAAANEALAQHTATRYQDLLIARVVSKQTTEEKVADALSKHAALESARANVQRLVELESFKFIHAPFDGVVTARKIDVGDLINASGTSATQLFQLAMLDKLRIFVQVPQTYAALMKPGVMASVFFVTHKNIGVAGRVVRTSHLVDSASRTLLCELELENPRHEYLAGSYLEVQFDVPAPERSVRVPAAALMFRPDGVRVAQVDAHGAVKLLKIEIGRDFGNEVEVISGVAAGQEVVFNPPDMLTDGQLVEVVVPTTVKSAPGTGGH